MTSEIISPRAVIDGLNLAAARPAAQVRVLHALIFYGWESGLPELAAAARMALPPADPDEPPEAWVDSFRQGTAPVPEDGVGARALACWRAMGEAERRERMVNPALGRLDAGGAHPPSGAMAGRSQAAP